VELNAMANAIYFTLPGAPLGEIKHNDFIPHHALALANTAPLEVPRVELDLPNALAFLRGETCTVEPGQGWAIAQYQGIALGWLKRMGARMNNYYPKEWRIRMR
jgi:NOL1/NOP2/fmu family ribosome biogenesis protein